MGSYTDRTAGQFANSYTGTAEQPRRAIDQISSTINRATETATNAAKRLSADFSQDYRWSIATLTMGAFLLGLLLGSVLHWWMNPKAAEVPQPAPAAVIQPPASQGNATTTSSKPTRNKRAQPDTPAEA